MTSLLPVWDRKGFTLIELMAVMAIIGVLAAIAIPNFMGYRVKAMESEGYALAGDVRKEVQGYYDVTGTLPEDNARCGLPEPIGIQGKYVGSITVKDGRILVAFKEGEERLKGVQLRLSPAVGPSGIIRWENERIEDL